MGGASSSLRYLEGNTPGNTREVLNLADHQ